jgi:cysteine-rich repeat protein
MNLYSLRFLQSMGTISALCSWLSCSSEEILLGVEEPQSGERAAEVVISYPEDEELPAITPESRPPTPVPAPVPILLPPPPVVVVPVVELGECGNAKADPNEECDDGNKVSGDGCNKECQKESCGDGRVNNNDENCDDGNGESNDGCDANCHTELSFIASSRSTLDVGNTQSCYKDDTRWQVKCWGSNNQGELGQENTEEIGNGVGKSVEDTDPIRFGSGVSAALVVAGGNSSAKFSCLVTSAGTLKCFGDNSSGQLGKGNTTDLGDSEDEMGNHLTPISLGSGRRVQDADAGGKHVCALLDNLLIKCFGENGFGQLGQGNTLDLGDNANELGDNLTPISLGTNRTATHVATGEDFSCAILDDASLKCWGRNDAGQLGQGNTNSLGDAPNEMGDNLVAIDLGTGRTAIQVSTGAKHSCVLLDNASVKCFGNNSLGQLGQGNTNNLGDGAAEMGDALLAIDLGAGRTATAIAAGDNFTCVLLDNAAVKCFGDNASGQLGQGNSNAIGDGAGEMGDNLAAINLGSDRTATIIAAGGSTTCVVLDNQELKCFGENGYGQLGQNSTVDIGNNVSEMGDNLAPITLGF